MRAIIVGLPILVGITYVREGLKKAAHYDPSGWVKVFAGLGLIVGVVFMYFYALSEPFS